MATWRFGATAVESEAIFIFTRAQAFVSKAGFDPPVCVLRVGVPAAGCIGPTSGDPKSAHPLAWNVTTSDEWIRASPTKYPIQFELIPGCAVRSPSAAVM